MSKNKVVLMSSDKRVIMELHFVSNFFLSGWSSQLVVESVRI
jgi:hypothetical protein